MSELLLLKMLCEENNLDLNEQKSIIKMKLENPPSPSHLSYDHSATGIVLDKTSATLICQKNRRGSVVRKQLRSLKDCMTPELLDQDINSYLQRIRFEIKINSKFSVGQKKIRKTNFPSDISENIVKFVFRKKYGVIPSWNTDKGDLYVFNKFTRKLRLEVKGSIDLSNGPPTFGPKEHWDWIYFVDGVDILNKNIKVYEVKLSNEDDIWRALKVSKTQTFEDQSTQKRRPRIKFATLRDQIGDHFKEIYSGPISGIY